MTLKYWDPVADDPSYSTSAFSFWSMSLAMIFPIEVPGCVY